MQTEQGIYLGIYFYEYIYVYIWHCQQPIKKKAMNLNDRNMWGCYDIIILKSQILNNQSQ